jgi:mono/diheme cytochrome c family protein
MAINMNISRNTVFASLAGLVILAGCKAKGDNPGLEYAPNMYHSVAYEPLSQITDEGQGKWLSSREDEVGEFYNSNPNNPHNMTMRVPAPNTVKRTTNGTLPYRLTRDSIEYAAANLKNPLEDSEAIIAEGKLLYSRFCYSCHGSQGQGDGPVAEVYKGVPAYNAGRYKTLSEGHVFHTITHGKGRMYAHGSQISIENRWKIVKYVQQLQNQ